MNNPNFKELVMLNLQTLTSFPYIEQDFDALTNYELLCKVVNELNKVIENQNITNQSVLEMYQAFNTLKNYVDNYFANLDVQEEINNKLDEMSESGELTNLIKDYINPFINAQNNEINEFKTDVNNEINIMNNKIQNIEGITPIPVANTTQMTDTTKIYLNLTDGKWYWYDGTNWTAGGDYQAIEISEGSVDYMSLDDNLKDNFSPSFGSFQNLGTSTNGLIKNNNGVLQIQSSDNYAYYVIDLSIGETYNFTGYNISDMCGLLIVDSNDNILFDSNINVTSSYTFFNYITKIKQNGLKAYMGYNVSSSTSQLRRNQNPSYRVIDKVSNTLLLNLTPKELNNYNGYVNYNANTGSVTIVANQNATAKMYAIDKGKKYKFKTLSYGVIKGLVITNENYEVQYIVPESVTPNEFEYQYSANDNGFAFLTKYLNYQAEIEVVNETIENLKESIIEETQEKISQQVGFNKWYAIGDSITATTYRASKNYLTYIEEDIPSLTVQNMGVSGSGYKNGNNTFIDRIANINNYNLNTDIVTVMGSINDIQYVSTALGELGDTTTDTLYGCMYSFFYNLFYNFNGVRVGCISPIIAKTYYTNKTNWEKYLKALKDTCELFNVPYLDLIHNTNLRPTNDTFLNEYYLADGEGNTGQIDTTGVHPNSKGYKLFYQRIKEFIKTL